MHLLFYYSRVFDQVDALSAAGMLCQMLRADNIAHSVRPVNNFDHVLSTVTKHLTSDIRTIFMINCGAVILLLLLSIGVDYHDLI